MVFSWLPFPAEVVPLKFIFAREVAQHLTVDFVFVLKLFNIAEGTALHPGSQTVEEAAGVSVGSVAISIVEQGREVGQRRREGEQERKGKGEGGKGGGQTTSARTCRATAAARPPPGQGWAVLVLRTPLRALAAMQKAGS